MELGYILNEIPEDPEEQKRKNKYHGSIYAPLKLRLQEGGGAMAELSICVLYRTACL